MHALTPYHIYLPYTTPICPTLHHPHLPAPQAEEPKADGGKKWKGQEKQPLKHSITRTVSAHMRRQLLVALAAGGSTLAQLYERGVRHEKDWRGMQEQVRGRGGGQGGARTGWGIYPL